jgi:6-phosphofructokinase
MKLQAVLFTALLLLTSCASKQEEVAVLNEQVAQQEKQITKVEKQNKQLKKQVAKKQQVIVEYKAAEKKMIRELEDRFKEFHKQADLLDEKLNANPPAPEPVKFEAVNNQEDETFVVNEKTHEVETKKQADSIVGQVAIEEKDAIKEQQDLKYKRNLALGAILLACILICFVIFRFF